MLDRLYCPDFGSIFGEMFRNPYDWPMIDSLVWPTFSDINLPPETEALLALTSEKKSPAFYRRKVTIAQFVTELKASNLEGACIQAMELGRSYGIPSNLVLEVARKYPGLLFPIISAQINEAGVSDLRETIHEAAAVVIYPSYQNIDLANPPAALENICSICAENNVPIKIDLGNMYIPEKDPTLCTVDKVHKFVSNHAAQQFIISGIDLLNDGEAILNVARWERNVFVELDPRTISGMTPEGYFTRVFNIPGFIQNTWSRILLGSSTPMLESSQITRGWWEATNKLGFEFQCLLRTWMYRNIHRIISLKIKLNVKLSGVDEAKSEELLKPRIIRRSENEIFVQQDLSLV
jgi:hypothetical protein